MLLVVQICACGLDVAEEQQVITDVRYQVQVLPGVLH